MVPLPHVGEKPLPAGVADDKVGQDIIDVVGI